MGPQYAPDRRPGEAVITRDDLLTARLAIAVVARVPHTSRARSGDSLTALNAGVYRRPAARVAVVVFSGLRSRRAGGSSGDGGNRDDHQGE